MGFLRARLGRGYWALLLTVIYLISQSLIAGVLHPVQADKLLLALQFSYNAADIQLLLNQASPEQIQALQAHFKYDGLHPIWYGLMIIALISWLMNLNRFSASANWMLWPAVLMSAADYVENHIHYPWFHLQQQATDPQALIAGASATFKWSLAALYLLLLFALTIRYFLNRKEY